MKRRILEVRKWFERRKGVDRMANHKNPPAVILIILASIGIIFLLHLYTTFFLPNYYGISTGDIVLIITAGAIFWYAWETHNLRRETVRQSELNLCPMIVVDMTSDNFVYENKGRGVALNVKTDDVVFKTIGGPPFFTMSFEKLTYLGLGGRVTISGRVVDERNNFLNWSVFFENFNPVVGTETFVINIRYTDILGTPYHTKFQCGREGVAIREFGKG